MTVVECLEDWLSLLEELRTPDVAACRENHTRRPPLVLNPEERPEDFPFGVVALRMSGKAGTVWFLAFFSVAQAMTLLDLAMGR